MDRHAETREARRRKARQGMAVRGRSILTVQRVAEKKGKEARARRGAR